ALQLLANEPAHLLVADARDQRRFQAQTRGAHGNVGRAPANGFCKAADILKPRADLLAVKVHRGATNGDHIERFFRAHLFLPGGYLCEELKHIFQTRSNIEFLFHYGNYPRRRSSAMATASAMPNAMLAESDRNPVWSASTS